MEFTEDELDCAVKIAMNTILACEARLRNKVASSNCEPLSFKDLELETGFDKVIPCAMATIINRISHGRFTEVFIEEEISEIYQNWLAIAQSEFGNG